MNKLWLIPILALILVAPAFAWTEEWTDASEVGSAWGNWIPAGANADSSTHYWINFTLNTAQYNNLKFYFDSDASHGDEYFYSEAGAIKYYNGSYFTPHASVANDSVISIQVNKTADTVKICDDGSCSTSYGYADADKNSFTVEWGGDGANINLTTSSLWAEITPASGIELNVTLPLSQTYYTDIPLNMSATNHSAPIDTYWYWNGSDNVVWTTYTTVPVADGSHTFRFYVNDTLGNQDNVNVTFSKATLGGDYLLNPSEAGFNSETRAANYERVLDAILTETYNLHTFDYGGKTVTFARWFTSSDTEAEADLHDYCHPTAATYDDYCVVTDEWSKIFLDVGMSQDATNEALMQQLLDGLDLSWREDGKYLPEWVFRIDNSSGTVVINKSKTTDDASDANARVILGLRAAFENPFYTSGTLNMTQLNNTINNMCEAFSDYNYYLTSKTSLVNGSKTITYFPRGGTNVGAMTNGEFMYTGYYGDNIMASGACYTHTGETKHLTQSQDAAETWFAAANWTPSTGYVKFPPGRSWHWSTDTAPYATCDVICTPPRTDTPDGKRWTSICTADYFFTNYINETLHPWLPQFCSDVIDHADVTSTAYVIEWNSDNSTDQTYSSANSGEAHVGLGMQVAIGGGVSYVSTYYDQIGVNWDAADDAFYGHDASSGKVMGIYEPTFALDSMGYALGYLNNVFGEFVGGGGGGGGSDHIIITNLDIEQNPLLDDDSPACVATVDHTFTGLVGTYSWYVNGTFDHSGTTGVITDDTEFAVSVFDKVFSNVGDTVTCELTISQSGEGDTDSVSREVYYQYRNITALDSADDSTINTFSIVYDGTTYSTTTGWVQVRVSEMGIGNFTVTATAAGYNSPVSKTVEFTNYSPSTANFTMDIATLNFTFTQEIEAWIDTLNCVETYDCSYWNGTNIFMNASDLSQGYITLRFNPDGSSNYQQYYKFYNDQMTTINIALLAETVDLTQEIMVSYLGQPIDGARVCAYAVDTDPLTNQTDWVATYCEYTVDDGIALLVLNDQNNYKFCAEHEDYSTACEQQVIPPSNSEVFVIEVEPISVAGGARYLDWSCPNIYQGTVNCTATLYTYSESSSICGYLYREDLLYNNWCGTTTSFQEFTYTLDDIYANYTLNFTINGIGVGEIQHIRYLYDPDIEINWEQPDVNGRTIVDKLDDDVEYLIVFYIILAIIGIGFGWGLEKLFKGYGLYGTAAWYAIIGTAGVSIFWIPASMIIIWGGAKLLIPLLK